MPQRHDAARSHYVSTPLAIRALNAVGRATGFAPRVDGDAILRGAIHLHGHDTELPPVSREALMVRARSYDEDARLSLFGRLVVRKNLKHRVASQLAFERTCLTKPGVLEERIEKPLFVVGLPRTGTTLMQRLLCQHEGARYLPFWEAHEPVPREGMSVERDLRLRRRAGSWAVRQINYVAPLLRKVHPIVSADDPEECYHLMLCAQFMPPGFDFGRLTSYWNWFDSLPDQAIVYRTFERQLKVLQARWHGEHWVLKTPVHMALLSELLKVFPDARIVYMQRDPVHSVASLASLVALTWSMISDDVDLHEVGSYVLDGVTHMEEVAERALNAMDQSRLVRVKFERFMLDPVATAEAAYATLGYRQYPKLGEHLRKFMVSNPREKHGRHVYDLADFGLDATMVATSLRRLREGHRQSAA